MQGKKEKEGVGGRAAREKITPRERGGDFFWNVVSIAMRITEENLPAESIFTSLFAFLSITRIKLKERKI